MTRIGLVLCTCDDKLNKNIQMDAFEYVFRTSPEVTHLALAPHVCLPDGRRALRATILENHLDHVVVAACPARYQEKRLEQVCVDAGIPLNYFTLVDWREGCAWAHRESKETTTAKAIDLLQMALARVILAEPVAGLRAPVKPLATVIGGGLAGMTAAQALAQQGIPVTLVEKEPELGGRLAHADLNGSGETYRRTLRAVLANPGIRVMLNTRVAGVEGTAGDYRVKLERDGKAAATVEAGAVILATGAQEHCDPALYRYDGRRVLTLGEFETQLYQPSFSAAQDPSIFRLKRFAFLLCAGSRDATHPYCSSTCCLAALSQARRLKQAIPEAHVTILFRDLYLGGDDTKEELVLQARRMGIEFVRYTPETPPQLSEDGLTVHDRLTGNTRRVPYDRLILATAQVPRPESGMLARQFRLTPDANGFLPDPHVRLRPEQAVERGIFIAGSAHRPVDMDTAILQGRTAAARAAHWLQAHEVTRPAWNARVNAELCTGCAQCVETCALHAIDMRPLSLSSPSRGAGENGRSDFHHAYIDPLVCAACGNCVAACPSKAITMPRPSDRQMLAQIDAALAPRWGDEPRILVLGCQWSGVAAMELAGRRRMAYTPHMRMIELPCSARLDPLHVLYALAHGADGVMLALCPPDECHFGNGNEYAEERVRKLRAQLDANRIDARRLKVARMTGDDATAWVNALAAFREDLRRVRMFEHFH